MNKKYRLLQSETINYNGVKLYRIQSLIDIPKYNIKKGQKGGFVESEKNLLNSYSEYQQRIDTAWIDGNAKVYGDAVISGDVYVYDNATISGDITIVCAMQIGGNTRITGNGSIFGYININ